MIKLRMAQNSENWAKLTAMHPSTTKYGYPLTPKELATPLLIVDLCFPHFWGLVEMKAKYTNPIRIEKHKSLLCISKIYENSEHVHSAMKMTLILNWSGIRILLKDMEYPNYQNGTRATRC